MNLREALADISEIRLRLARAEVFPGYRAGPTAFSGVVAVAAALLQGALVPRPASAPLSYLSLWVGAAVVSAVTAGVVMALHYRRSASPFKRQTAWLAAEQFVPALVSGALVPLALARFAPAGLGLPPGLCRVLSSLGLFASCRHMPRPMPWVALFYLVTGTACIALARGPAAFSPWAMGLPFGAGQLLTAGVLWWSLERGRVAA